LRHRAELSPLLEAAAAALPSARLLAALAAAQVPAGPINTLDRALADPQVRHRNMVVELADGDGDTVRVADNPVKMSGEPARQPAYPHRLGADTGAILRELGVAEEEVLSLANEGVIALG
jgi:CoA:oxalate CoA-transferase